jgi:hypothetical protein
MSNKIVTLIFVGVLGCSCAGLTVPAVQGVIGTVAACAGLVEQILGAAAQFKDVSKVCDKAVVDRAGSRDYKELREIASSCAVMMDSYAAMQSDLDKLKKGDDKDVCTDTQEDVAEYLADLQAVITLLQSLGYPIPGMSGK